MTMSLGFADDPFKQNKRKTHGDADGNLKYLGMYGKEECEVPSTWK